MYRFSPAAKFLLAAVATLTLSAVPASGRQPAPDKLDLWPTAAPIGDGTSEDTGGTITVYRPDPHRANGTAMIICPGGGYGGLVRGPEGSGIAAWLVQHGITGIVLEYRLPAGRPFVPLMDASRAIRMVRTNAQHWGLNPARIGIIGFSAGGHLASTAATHFDKGDAKSTDAIERESSRPDFAVLVYPVITMGDATHGGSKKNLLGPTPTEKLVHLFSNEKQVTDRTPPTFLAHAVNDKPVPPDNSRLFYAALKAHGVPAKYLELPEGGHGLNGYSGPMWAAWQQKSLAWLAAQGFIPNKDADSGEKNSE
jgi:acetyl esterase/lipase